MATERRQEQQSIAVRRRERLFPSWREEIERFFDRPFRAFGLWPWRSYWRRWPSLWAEEAWAPDIDVFERDGKLVVQAELPGMKREDIAVEVQDNTLIISGKRQEEREVREENYYCAERARGEFSRAISLPEGADANAIQATYKDGVLEVTVPMPSAEKKARPIKVEIT